MHIRLVSSFALVIAGAACSSAQPSQTPSLSFQPEKLQANHEDLALGAHGDAVQAVNAYLTESGYFPNASLAQTYPSWRPLVSKGSADANVFDEQTAAGIRALQVNHSLPDTGVVDTATRALMLSMRCGTPEGIPLLDTSDKYDIGGKLSASSITWNTTGTTRGLTAAQVQQAAANATATWAAQISLGISQSSTNPTIGISFGPLGPGVIGSTNSQGQITLTDGTNGITFSLNGAAGTADLQTTILHEFGHSLGLNHSSFTAPVMFGVLNAAQKQSLDIDDKVAVSVNYDQWASAMPGGGTDIAVGPDESTWIIGGDQRIYKWNGTQWVIDASAGLGVNITVDSNGHPWIVGTNGQPYNYSTNDPTTGHWVGGPTTCATDIGAGADGSVWITGCTGSPDHPISKLVGSSWVAVSAGGAAVRIAAGPTGVPWVVNNAGQISFLSSNDPTTGTWSTFTNAAATDIGLSQTAGDMNNYAWVIGTGSVGNGDFGVYSLDQQPSGTQGSPPPNAVLRFRQVSGGGVRITVDLNGNPNIVNHAGHIFHRVR